LGSPLPASEGVEGGSIGFDNLLWRLLVCGTLECGEDLGLKLGVTLHVQEGAVLQHLRRGELILRHLSGFLGRAVSILSLEFVHQVVRINFSRGLILLPIAEVLLQETHGVVIWQHGGVA
jgi:hypothetical protein